MKIHWKKVFYYFLVFDFLFAIKSCNVSPEEEVKDFEISNKENLNSFTISGIVTKNDCAEPIPFCEIKLLNPDSMIIVGSTSDFNGQYTIPNIPPRKYILKISSIGFQTKIIEINLNSDSIISTSLQYIKSSKPQIETHTMCYILINDSNYEANKKAMEDFFNGINTKDSTLENKETIDTHLLNK